MSSGSSVDVSRDRSVNGTDDVMDQLSSSVKKLNFSAGARRGGRGRGGKKLNNANRKKRQQQQQQQRTRPLPAKLLNQVVDSGDMPGVRLCSPSRCVGVKVCQLAHSLQEQRAWRLQLIRPLRNVAQEPLHFDRTMRLADRPLLILDVNGTLAFRSSLSPAALSHAAAEQRKQSQCSTDGSTSDDNDISVNQSGGGGDGEVPVPKADFTYRGKHVWRRPHLDSFLAWCFDRFGAVAVFTSMTRRHLDPILRGLLTEEQLAALLFVGDQTSNLRVDPDPCDCNELAASGSRTGSPSPASPSQTPPGKGKPGNSPMRRHSGDCASKKPKFVKPLDRLLFGPGAAVAGVGRFSAENTVILDDTARKLEPKTVAALSRDNSPMKPAERADADSNVFVSRFVNPVSFDETNLTTDDYLAPDGLARAQLSSILINVKQATTAAEQL